MNARSDHGSETVQACGNGAAGPEVLHNRGNEYLRSAASYLRTNGLPCWADARGTIEASQTSSCDLGNMTKESSSHILEQQEIKGRKG